MSADYFGLTACAKENGLKTYRPDELAKAQKILVEMVQQGRAEWVPDYEMFAVRTQMQLPLDLTSPATSSIGLREKLKEPN